MSRISASTRILPIATLAIVAATACGGDDSPSATATTAGTASTIEAKDVDGHWRSDEWGDMYLETDASGLTRGVYPHDLGTVQGRIEDGVFVGWWCEAPSRQQPGDAGAVEFTFMRDPSGSLSLDGRWKYGADEPQWRENLDLVLVDDPVDEATRKRLENPSEFCKPP